MVTEEKIWEYLDGTLNESERLEVEYAIANDSTIASLYRDASSLHTTLSTQSAEHPSMAFTENIMRAIQLQHHYIPAPRVPVWPLIISTVPFLIVLALACAVFLNTNIDLPSLFHSTRFTTDFINIHFVNTIKLLFVMIDGVLLILFIEQWLVAKKKGLV